MNIEKLFEMQKVLDERIIKEHGLEGTNLIENKLLALDVEISELANETRCFKHWSKKGPSPVKVILEEYVDGIHFILSIGNEIDFNIDEWELSPTPCCDGLNVQLLEIKTIVVEIYQRYSKRYSLSFESEYVELFEMYLGLGEMLGFTWEQIEQAYMDKNKVNHQRQDSGY